MLLLRKNQACLKVFPDGVQHPPLLGDGNPVGHRG
jgi:hypothetical protein